MEERLQKLMARCGFGSRRACEEMITTGRVTVNGAPAELGMKADPYKDLIRIDGEKMNYTEPEKVYIMLNKPRFVLSDRDNSDPRRTVFSLVENSEGLFVVGRLDCESEGLMLLTNDGDLANKLSHPRYGKEKEYQVLAAKRPDEKQLKAWRHGIVLEDGTQTGPAQVVVSSLSGKGCWLRVIMTEGHKREIREICKTISIPVVRLVRVRLGSLELGDLKSGEYKPLNENQVKSLRALVSGKPRAEIQAAAYARIGEQEARAEDRKEARFRGKQSRGGASYGKSAYGKRNASDSKGAYEKRESTGRASYGHRDETENKGAYEKREYTGRASYSRRDESENKGAYEKREYRGRASYGRRDETENKSTYGKREYTGRASYGRRDETENKGAYGKRESTGRASYGRRDETENKGAYEKREHTGRASYGRRDETENKSTYGKRENQDYRKSEKPRSEHSGNYGRSGNGGNGTKKYPKKKVM